jgi:hypothetical protein
VTGQENVPKYMFTSDALGTTYKIMYQKIYETDAFGKKVSQVSMPSLKWAFSQDATDSSVFYIKNVLKGSEPWTKLEFKHILE